MTRGPVVSIVSIRETFLGNKTLLYLPRYETMQKSNSNQCHPHFINNDIKLQNSKNTY